MSLTCVLDLQEYLVAVDHDPQLLHQIVRQTYARAETNVQSNKDGTFALCNVHLMLKLIDCNTHAQNYFTKFGQNRRNISLRNARHYFYVK